MKKLFCVFAIVLSLLQSCKWEEGPCKGYENSVARMNLPQLSTADYNTVETAFYRLGHWTACIYATPLPYGDSLMVYGYITDTLQGDAVYKMTGNAVPAENDPFVLVLAGGHLPDSTKQSIQTKINSGKGKKVYVKGLFVPGDYKDHTGVFPPESIPGDWGEDWERGGAEFTIPMIMVQHENNIHFEN